MTMTSSVGVGRFTTTGIQTGVNAGDPSNDAYYWDPSFVDHSLPPIIFCGGGANNPGSTPWTTGGFDIATELTARGAIIVHPYVPWLIANDESLTRISDAYNYAVANLDVDATRPPFICGISNGALCLTRWMKTHDICGGSFWTAPVNIDEAYQNPNSLAEIIGDVRAKIEAAHNIEYPEPLPAGVDPWPERDLYRNLGNRLQWWIASDDFFGYEYQAAWSAWLSTDSHNVGRLNHSATAVDDGVDPVNVADFFEHCVALAA